MTRKRVHWGHTPFRVNTDPECGQFSADLTNKGVRLTQLWVIFRVKLTDSVSMLTRNGVWSQWTLFRVKFDPGVFRVQGHNGFHYIAIHSS